MKEVYPDIFLIKERRAFNSIRPEVNVFLIAGKDGLIFDAGFGTRKTVKFLSGEIKKIEKRYRDAGKEFSIKGVMPSHSHGDHFNGIKLLRKYLGLKIIVTDRIAQNISHRKIYRKNYNVSEKYRYIKRGFFGDILHGLMEPLFYFFYQRIFGFSFINDPDEIIKENSEILINDEKWRIISAPGHSFDHVHLYNEEKGLLFAGDNVLRTITPWLGPPDSDLKQYLNTLEQILKLPRLNMIFAGHGSPIGNPVNRIKNLIEYRKERINFILEIVNNNSEKGITINQILNKIYSNEAGFKKRLSFGWVAVTLKYLEDNNSIIKVEEKRKIKLFPVP